MIVECENCSKKYKLSPESANASNGQFTCSSCGHVTQVHNVAAAADGGPAHRSDYSTSARTEDQKQTPRTAFKDSIKTKLGVVLIIVSVIILGAYSAINYYTTKSDLTEELNQYAKNTAKRLALTLSVPVWEVNENAAWEIINSEMLDKRVYAVLVYEKNGSTIFQAAARTPDWKIEKVASAIRGSKIESTQNIEMHNEKVGSVEVFVTDQFMRSSIMQSTRELFTAMLVQILVLLVAMYIALKKMLIDPIAKLTMATEQISLGNLTTSINIQSRDEVGILAHAIERMQTSLRILMKRYQQ